MLGEHLQDQLSSGSLFWNNYHCVCVVQKLCFTALIGVGVSCHISYSIVSYLYVSCSGSITSAGEERAKRKPVCTTIQDA